ncbi:MAG: PQQ-binding-like beta-propeller repeat protein [Gemmatimonadetes bacterium]|nr:PQQ-binding-like beta-propeller repeat protein [Gemmatimonadota bacterium]MYE16801.1 PQQ-binding-like beta-propeller repeat protein [Gemmatimonadota bacterium]MYG21139.1 PQQ-binding-like beta-propeller repeat protein [Gemmatimonadota bacterium]MYJ38019.1 PQQ-binding-like beta-propeller repeat protein [Gemmatimonadota bacterium]
MPGRSRGPCTAYAAAPRTRCSGPRAAHGIFSFGVSRRAAVSVSQTLVRNPVKPGNHLEEHVKPTHRAITAALALATAVPLAAPSAANAQQAEWRHWGSDAASTRYSPLGQIDATNFNDLEVAWIWRSDNFSPEPEPLLRATPIYVDGTLYSVAGSRRTAVAIDPATGETLWTFRESYTRRWEDSMRKNYGKGVAYAEVNGRETIYLVTPGFFLHALDPMTGASIESFGRKGKVDLLGDLGHWEHHPDDGLPPEVGYITNSSPPIVVNGVVVVGNSHEQGYYQTMQENVPGNILAYDADTGEHLWTFNVIPQQGEFGNDTWESDAWKHTGNVSAWAPLSADAELGLVYVVTDPPTVDYYGGFHPGDNLFATSILALDVETGERRWHFQTVHHDVWNYDNPTAPNLVDVNVDGREISAIVQTTKQGWAYVLDRETGEPVWPIEERPVPQSDVPGEQLSPTQPYVTRPAPYEMQGISEDDLIDFTPELRAEALEIVSNFRMGPLFNPPAREDGPGGPSIHCPGANGGANIPGGAAVDPATGILYVASTRGCSAPRLVPGVDVDPDSNVEWVSVGPGGVRGPRGLPITKPPYSTITAIDLNTGDHVWQIPNGDTPESVRNHPALQGVDVGNTGSRGHATKLVTSTLLMYGEGRGAAPVFRAVDKMTGEELGRIDLPGSTLTAPMTYMHDGVQYVVMAIGMRGSAGALVALRLPE